MTRKLAAVVIVATLGIPITARAQDPRGYVGAAVMLSTQGSHRQGSAPSLPTTGAGGTAIGAIVEAGGFLTQRLALGIEISLPRRFTALQETDYLRVFQQESHHRDMAISGVFRAIAGSTSRAQLGIVAGGGVVQESSLQRRRDQAGVQPTYPPVFGPYSEQYSFTRWTVSALAGTDVQIPITSHASIVPQIRVHFVRRSSEPSEQGWGLGLSSVIVRPAVCVRAMF